ncbi:MAG: type II secretion system F family protein [Dehalococcoidia bacterium]|nr:type II secretion system F family protein [Dehalococcoidia bacterium]
MTLVLAIGAGVAVWLLVIGLTSGEQDEKERREELLARVRGDHPDRATTSQAAPQQRRSLFAGKSAGAALRGASTGIPARMEPALVRAGFEARPREFTINAAIVGAILGTGAGTFIGPAGFLLGGLFALVGAWWLVQSRTKKRLGRINSQLVDLLQVVAGGLTAGQSFLQSVAAAAREIGDPIASELRLFLNEIELGATMDGAFERLRNRVGDEDLSLVIDAVLIQRRVGGNLAEVLTNISWTIRERIRIRGEVAALTGQAKMSGWVLGGLPVGLAMILTAINPNYMSPLFTTDMGRLMLAGGIVSEVAGFIVMRKIASVQA